MRFDAVVFDFDGTLADTARDVWASVEYAAMLAGGRLREGFTAVPENLSLPLEEIYAVIEPSRAEEGFVSFKENIAMHYRKRNPFAGTRLYPGMESFLKELKNAGIPCCIVSAKPEEALERVLEVKGWGGYFLEWLSNEPAEGKMRTKAEAIGRLLEKHPDWKAPVYVGDSYTDVTAAARNRMECIGVLYGDGDRDKVIAENPAYTAENVAQIAAVILGK